MWGLDTGQQSAGYFQFGTGPNNYARLKSNITLIIINRLPLKFNLFFLMLKDLNLYHIIFDILIFMFTL